ncbi:MAG TPA: BadF/BadG/BcrA/BcrD ATPase family protein, partial [Planctomycetaceae bacterium]|nr:BadF/BadG/BcrA/BcrD ATPase family protein [Planctomycetaceae bacterium]
GGTKTVAWIAPLDDPTGEIVLGRGVAGPGNPRAVGFDAAQRQIQLAITHAFDSAQQPPEMVAAAWFGVAGAGRESEQQQLADWARASGIADRVSVSGDAEPILAAGSAEHTGIALIAGTGSLAWGRNAAGQVARTGGCGYLLGDEGSAYAIAMAALRAAMQSADGRRPPTTLLPQLLEFFQAHSPANLIEILYSGEMTRDQIASCTPIVFAAADDDPAAATILSQAAEDLAVMITALAEKLGFEHTRYALAITGGLLLHQDRFRQAVLDRLSAHPPGSVTLVTEPVRGAVALARRLVASA